MQHRIFLAPTRTDLPWDDARRHWQERHGSLFCSTPGLLRYVQNRPLTRQGRGVVCSETWFDSREAERAAYASSYYLDVVTPDEERFLDREAAWNSRVTSVASDLAGIYRVLWFGEAPPEGVSWNPIRLSRPVPEPGGGECVYSTWTDDQDFALDLAAGSGGLALACRPIQFPIPRTTEEVS